MALYLGGEKVTINLNGIVYKLKLFSETPILNGVLFASSEDCILKDMDGLYLTAKEDEE